MNATFNNKKIEFLAYNIKNLEMINKWSSKFFSYEILKERFERDKNKIIDICDKNNFIYDLNAISTMITNGEFEIEKVVCIGSEGNFMMPCGACMEYMMQLSEESENIEILKNLETKEIITLKELIPIWWGKEK